MSTTTMRRDIAVAGTVVESDPPRRLVLTWAPARTKPTISRVTFEIEDFMGSARLDGDARRAERSQMLSKISAGWPTVISSLKSLLETGASLPMTRRQWRKAS